MISDRIFANKILSESGNCFEKLNALLVNAKDTLPRQEFEGLRQGIGMVLGYLYTDIEAPIYRQHPDLEPTQPARFHKKA